MQSRKRNPRAGVMQRADTAMRFTNAKLCSAALLLTSARASGRASGQTAGSGREPPGRQPERPFLKWKRSIQIFKAARPWATAVRLRRFLARRKRRKPQPQSYTTSGKHVRANCRRFFFDSSRRRTCCALARKPKISARKKYTPVGEARSRNDLARPDGAQDPAAAAHARCLAPLHTTACSLLLACERHLVARAGSNLALAGM